MALTGKASDAAQTITSGVTAMRSTGTTMWMPLWLSYLARANAEIGQFDDARRCIGEAMTAMETTKERWYEAEVNRIAGEIALLSPEPDVAKAQACFERALAIARKQQAKSWELRAAMSMARLWRDQGRRAQARDLLAPVYGWFTQGFDTLDLKQAEAFLDDCVPAELGAIMDLGSWLRSLGLERYEAAFRENEIDDTVLPSLTAEDLKDLGVGIVGHRRKLLDAIAALRADASAKAPPPDAAPATDRAAKDTAERRQVTVMFSDLVGSTALSARMDPEDLREVISAYQKCVAETVRRFGGFVAKYMGDGVLVYFGYPQAHEDDAERAVRAGLELIAAVGGLEDARSAANPRRHCDRAGRGRRPDRIGEARRSAASSARRRTSRRACKGLPSRTRSSSPRARESFSAICSSLRTSGQETSRASPGRCGPGRRCGQAPSESRFEALHASGLTALVGREEELELLLRRWSRAKTGEGQVVLLSGEAGIGKSRLTAALLERLAAEPHTRLRYFCSPQHTDSALYPIIGQMERAAGLAHDDTPQAKLDKLDALLAQTSTSSAGRGTLCRDAVAAERWTLSRARADPAAAPAKNAGSAHRANGGADARKIRC